ncbi:MAG: class I SAM-dependent methyltransferase [Chryseolinea sp.]
MNTLNSYDSIAPIYDRLAGLVFGSSIRKAQLVHLNELANASTILIVGGGTGWILRDVLRTNGAAKILYVEASAQMIALAKKNVTEADSHRVTYIHSTENALSDIDQVDAVIINFFADLFTAGELVQVIQRFRGRLKDNGYLLCTDFVDDSIWQKAMLKVMYTFFWLTTGLSTHQLSSWRRIITDQHFKCLRSTAFWGRFIISELYQK